MCSAASAYFNTNIDGMQMAAGDAENEYVLWTSQSGCMSAWKSITPEAMLNLEPQLHVKYSLSY